MLGLEVDSMEHSGVPPLEYVVVGEILKRDQHPDADRLTVCEVKVSDSETTSIVCGAKNHKVGDRVPVALPGAVLPGNFKIKKSKLRGVPSAGMLCSPKELGLPDTVDGLLILEDRPEIGTPINAVFTDTDTIFDLEVTPNRGDCLSHFGVVRELAAFYGLEIKKPKATDISIANAPVSDSLFKALKVETEHCPYYTACSIKGLKVGPSPEWLVRDLQSIGLRSINNVVDVTNWVMMETGQPLHAFDAKKINGETIIVRAAKAGEKIITLDEKERKLDPSMMVIADSQRPLVVAGVMGSLDAEVDESTVDIVLESAYFNPSSIRATARQLGLSTDSSYRFARDVDPAGVEYAATRALDKIIEVAGGTIVGPMVVHGEAPRGDVTIDVKPEWIVERCGFEVAHDKIKQTFERLGFSVEVKGAEWSVTVPSFRSEVLRPIDLVEEFVRVLGTVNIPAKPVMAKGLFRKHDGIAQFNDEVSTYLRNQHFFECYHYSLVDGKMINTWYGDAIAKGTELANPLTSEMTHLRPSLIPGLLTAIKENLNHGNTPYRLFECGQTYAVSEEGTTELVTVAGVLLGGEGERSWQLRTQPEFCTVKEIAKNVLAQAGIMADKIEYQQAEAKSGWQVGHSAYAESSKQGFELKLGLVNLEMSKAWGIDVPCYGFELTCLPETLRRKPKEPRYKAFSSFPASSKDLALLVDKSIQAGRIEGELSKFAKEACTPDFTIETVRVFDQYTGEGLPEGKKSLAFEFIFRSDSRTLKDKEVNDCFERIQKAVKEHGQYSIRG